MNHMVLARKWRPKKFADLVGQDNTVKILQNIISSGRLHHAYLLTGTRGVGKTTIARIIAKALNCLNPEANEPCGICDNCRQIDIGRFVDVIEIDAASNTGVDNIREVLENSQYAPSSGKYKIYIIDEVHMLSKSAFNAMLKTLEEPPAHVVFILATTDPHKVPITILSRCLQLKLRNLAAPEIETYLAQVLASEMVGFEQAALEVIATAASGSMRDALSLTDQAIAFANGTITLSISQQMLGISDNGSIIALLDAIQSLNSPELVKICQRLNSEGANFENILEQINHNLFQIGLAQLSPQANLSPELRQLASLISLQDCQLYFEISNLGLEQLRKVNDKYPIFTMSLLRMVAFSIGSQEHKQILIQANNCTTQISGELITPTAQPQATHTSEIIATVVTTSTPSTQKPIYDTKVNKTQVAETTETPPWEEEAAADSILITPSDNLKLSEPEANSLLETEALKDNPAIDLVAAPVLEPQNTPPNAEARQHKQFNGNWLEFVQGIALDKIEVNLAIVLNNASQLNSLNTDEISLEINDIYRELVTEACVDALERMLFERYQQHFDLSFNFIETNGSGSLKQLEINQIAQAQQLAEQSIQADPIIQDLINNFSAKILPNSIKPL
ncbi:MAG: DNA polymerase III subunit gamma/tau [Burkholderiales bacterium]|nr:DNA polymerase III subunit gamma/tau [Burkholderiales bacterium]